MSIYLYQSVVFLEKIHYKKHPFHFEMLVKYEAIPKFEIYYRSMTSIFFCWLRATCSGTPQVLISPFELHLSSAFPLFSNSFVIFPFDSPLLIGEHHTEMGFGRNEFWSPEQWAKYSHLELIFPIFLNKILGFLPVSLSHFDIEKISDQSMYFSPVSIQKLWGVEVRRFYYSYHAVFVFVALF